MHTWSHAGLPQKQLLWQEFGCGPCVVSGGAGRGPEAPGCGWKAVPRCALRSGYRCAHRRHRYGGAFGKVGQMRLKAVSLSGEGFTCPLAATHAVGNCFRSIRSEHGWSYLITGVSVSMQADRASGRQRTCLL